jgi:hypothetical protein
MSTKWSLVNSLNVIGSTTDTNQRSGGSSAASARRPASASGTGRGSSPYLAARAKGIRHPFGAGHIPTINYLGAVAAVSATDAWAVGDYNQGGSVIGQTLIEHWNGTAWSVASSPNGGSNANELHGVAAAVANDVWAVGSRDGQTLTENYGYLILGPSHSSLPGRIGRSVR